MKYKTEAFGSVFPGTYLVLIMYYLHNFEYKANRYYSVRGKKMKNFTMWSCDKEGSIFIMNPALRRPRVES